MSFLYKKKPIDQLLNEASDQSNLTLARRLGTRSLILMGIGVVIGSGIFTLPGLVAGTHTGPSVILSFIIAAVACGLAGLCYAEFASMIPVAGSAYTYTYATLGVFAAWFIGWDLILEYCVAASMVAIGWSEYLSRLLAEFGWHIPPSLTKGPAEGGLINLPAVLIIAAISILLIRGVAVSARVNTVLVVIKVLIVVVFIISGWKYIQADHYTPFIPANTGIFGEYGWSGVLRGSGILFFCFLGFDAVSTTAQEAKNPQRTLPIGILGSLLICTILYLLFSYVFIGLVDYKDLKDGGKDLSHVATALSHIPGGQSLKTAVIFGILVGFTGVIMITLMAQSRIFYSMSRDKLVSPLFSSLHKKFKTPWKSNIVFALFAGAVAGFVPGSVVGELTSMGALLAFALVCLGVLILRKTQPGIPRPFKTPFYPAVPILGIVVCITLMVFLPLGTWWRLIIWTALGLVVFFAYSTKRIK